MGALKGRPVPCSFKHMGCCTSNGRVGIGRMYDSILRYSQRQSVVLDVQGREGKKIRQRPHTSYPSPTNMGPAKLHY